VGSTPRERKARALTMPTTAGLSGPPFRRVATMTGGARGPRGAPSLDASPSPAPSAAAATASPPPSPDLEPEPELAEGATAAAAVEAVAVAVAAASEDSMEDSSTWCRCCSLSPPGIMVSGPPAQSRRNVAAGPSTLIPDEGVGVEEEEEESGCPSISIIFLFIRKNRR
jgi:hypothetical protein